MTRSSRNRANNNARNIARWSPTATVRQYRRSHGKFSAELCRAFMRRMSELSPWFATEFAEMGQVNLSYLAELLNRR